MEILIPPVNVSFGDFALLAILLAIMYGLTGMEAALSAEREGGSKGQDRTRAAAYALAGILLTIVAGLVAQVGLGDAEITLFLVPFFFMGHWAYYHATSAKPAKLGALRKDLKDEYVAVVSGTLSEEPKTSDEIFKEAVEKLRTVKRLQSGFSIAKAVVPVPARSLVENLLFTPDKVDLILAELVNKRKARLRDGESGVMYMAPRPQRQGMSSEQRG